MDQSDREFWHIARTFLIRYNEYNREKGTPPLTLEDFDHTQAKVFSQQQLKQSAITKLTSIELKSDYHNLILLAFLQDLARWSKEYHLELAYHPAPLEAILIQSIQVLNNQQQFHTIVAKQHELISALLPLPNTLAHIDQLKTLYRRLKDVKEYFPAAIREHQKKCFLNAVEETVDRASQLRNIKVVQFIFGNIFNELEVLEETHEYVSHRLKIMKKIAKSLWIFHEDIIYKLAYLLMKFSYQVPTNPHLYSHLLPIYDCLIDKLLQRPAITALLLFKHLILNNIQCILKNGGSCIVLEGLLRQLSQNFTKGRLEYFMRNYDWNYLEVPIIQQSLNLLYEYCENNLNERKTQHQLVKIYLNRIHNQIKHYLQELKGARRDDSKWKFYQLKKKEYTELIQEMNQKPKKIFSRIQTCHNSQATQTIIQKYVRLIKKTAHLKPLAMINIFATDHPISAQLFSAYAQLMLKQCKQPNLQEFMRMFTSNFFLTGESQQIARVLDIITQFYFRKQDQNHRTLLSSDAAYTFANAILILNTDLHNPKNEEKISQESFLKMCKKINAGEDIPTEILRKIYNNIKKNKINTFRDRGNMLGISVFNWLALCIDYQSLPLCYYDPQLQVLDEPCLQYFIHDVLASIIDEKQTAKLQLLVQRFVYQDKVFECQIIQVIRKVVDKKPHLPMQILQKTLQLGNFKHIKLSDKVLSYYWLAAHLITTFPSLIPTQSISEFLVNTWYIRGELQDNMHLRQIAQIKRIKECIRTVNKREAKKSIMDMFSNFLSFKQSDEQPQPLPNEFNSRTNFKSISNNVFDVLKYQQNYKKLAIEFLINYIHNQQSKVYQQFLSSLFLTFNLLYLIENCQQAGEDLFYELLGVKESSITKRLNNLAKKDPKLYHVLDSYCKFWILKLLLKEHSPSKLEIKENNTYEYMLNKSLEYLEKVDREILQDLIKELQLKHYLHQHILDPFEKTIKKLYSNSSIQEVQPFLDKFKAQTNSDEINIEKETQMSKKLSTNKENEKQNVSQEPTSPQNCHQKQPISPKAQLQPTVVGQSQPEKGQKPQQKLLQPQPSLQAKGSSHSESLEQQKRDHIYKKSSFQNVQEQVNPDAVIDQIDQQIQHHLAKKAQEHLPIKPPVQALSEKEVKQQTQAKIEEQKSSQKQAETNKDRPSPSKQQETPSIPVIMF